MSRQVRIIKPNVTDEELDKVRILFAYAIRLLAEFLLHLNDQPPKLKAVEEGSADKIIKDVLGIGIQPSDDTSGSLSAVD